MANFRSTRDLKEDVLFRAYEPTGGNSQWDENNSKKVISYLNRSYRSLCTGASEFLPEYIEDWWWMRGRGVLYLLPSISAGTVSVAKGSATIVFSGDPVSYLDSALLDQAVLGPMNTPIDIRGWRLRIEGHPDVFIISNYNVEGAVATMDMPYTGETDSAATYTLMKDTYNLDGIVNSLLGPMISFRDNCQISGMLPERMDELWPVWRLQSGVPTAFSLEDERTVRFNAGGRSDAVAMRIEYRYKPAVDDLVDSTDSTPLVPLQYRHLLADMALVYTMIDKNDDRAQAANASARSGLAAMVKENRRRITAIDRGAGRFPGIRPNRLLMTESGLVVR